MFLSTLLLTVSGFLAPIVQGCDSTIHSNRDVSSVIAQNIQARNSRRPTCQPKTVIKNVRVFNGRGLSAPTMVVIEGGIIGTNPEGATVHVDGLGGVLLPGLIDSHCHPQTVSDIEALTRYGVTTAFTMACYTPDQCTSLQGHHGLVDIHTASAAAAAPGSVHGNMTLAISANPSLLVYNATDAVRWVDEQVANVKPEYIKIVAESPGLTQKTLNVLVHKAHGYGKRAICHAADLKSHRQATLAGADQIHHVPSDTVPGNDLVMMIRKRNQISVPTLSIMKALAGNGTAYTGRNYTVSQETVRVYKEAKIPILAGTDANEVITTISFGSSLHDELELLVQAGLSTVQALVSATSEPAQQWGLHDRGIIAPGKRADLVLIKGDPIADIKATRNIMKVWVAGEQYTGGQ